MIFINCEQGTEAWHQARAGVCTASTFAQAISTVGGLDEKQAKYVAAVRAGTPDKDALALAGYKAKPSSETVARAIAGEEVEQPSDASNRLAAELAIERISKKPYGDTFETFAMRRGKEQEAFARMRYEARYGLIVDEEGLILTDDRLFGCSVDGLVGHDGGWECKVPVDLNKVMHILKTGDLSEYMHQIQGCMWITGRKWWDFSMGIPDLAELNNGNELYVKRVFRDDNFIEDMEQKLMRFIARSRQVEKMLREPFNKPELLEAA